MLVPTGGKVNVFRDSDCKSEDFFDEELIVDTQEWKTVDEDDSLVDTLFNMPIFEAGLIDFSALLWSLEDDLQDADDLESILKGMTDSSNCMDVESSYRAADIKPSPPSSPDARTPQFQDKIRLYEFVIKLLMDDSHDCVRWISREDGEFEITNTARIASLWGSVKGNPTMTYEKFARALRHYYKLGILVNFEHKEKLRYKFSGEILSTKL